ncbi:MAG TPA: DNA polymerase III subunit delta [Ktedonobacterales bacterium]|jgi:DNA polymerase-3 subunit delta|nr:DNA polymerase III subunit delta [Ktedonobacterales bacterium]
MFILLHGPDEFSAHEELARLRATGGFEHNQDTFSGADADLATIRNVCDTVPFLSEKRLVVLEGLPKPKRGAKDEADETADGKDERESQQSPSSGRGKKGKGGTLGPRAFAQGLADYIPSLPDSTVLVVLVPEVLDAIHPLLKAAQRHGNVRTFAPLRGPQLENWLMRRARTYETKLAPEAAQLLVNTVGDDLRLLACEVDKLSTYVGAGGSIGPTEVRLLTPVARQARVFDLTDALARRDRPLALELLHELLASGESALGIVALAAFQTRTLLQVKLLAERGRGVGQIAQLAGLAPFVAEKSLPLARQFSITQLEDAHRALLEVDTALKRSRMTPEMALDLFILDFATPRH